MKNKKKKLILLEGLAETPLLDLHTHLDSSHLAARGLHDILLYHMLITELSSAGCPSRGRLPENPEEFETVARIEEAIPFLEKIHNTGMYWCLQFILKDLYNWNEPITITNWRKLDGMIREKASDYHWPRMILDEARIQRSCTEYWRRRDGSRDNLLQYCLEWAFFSRTQAGMKDISLYELERAWNQSEPSSPIPVTMGEQRETNPRKIITIDDVWAALDHYVDKIPADKIISTAQHLSTDIRYSFPSRQMFVSALMRRSNPTERDRDIYASYLLEGFLSRLEERAAHVVFQFSIGAEPLPFETGSKLRQDTIFELAKIIDRHPGLKFQAFLSSGHSNQALCTLARGLPNFSLAGYWWHNFFPSIIRKIIHERLDMLPVNKQVGFFSDAYCVEWSYAKAKLLRIQFAEVLNQKIGQGQYSLDEALRIAKEVFFETPQSLNGMVPNENR
jgi:glucuronate isomerase